ncbi:hypothetical protein PVAP13_1NG464600 [Panicum virgatum]|uniref:non-specific serine/threonine protein kinase n=1 Tax=Panicum virgatum TaxID=38727 RepID=A0A8T0WWG9_PANVG|nr:hypothetical protein PVAP13_1NG464600 [Panicum virgatum]
MYMNLKIFNEAVLGLSYLHKQGVMHRDIKSSNIFLDEKNLVRIGDFGSGALIGSSSCMGGGKFWGTAFYASCELWCSNAHSDIPDVFSLGVVYFELFGDFGTIDTRCRRLEELERALNSRSWKTKPLET